VSSSEPEFASISTRLESAETRATLDVAPDEGGWYKVCAAIRETTKVRAIAG